MGCCGGGGGWAGGAPAWQPGNEGQLFQWEVTLPGGGPPIVYDTDSQAYAAVAKTGGGVRRIKKPGS